MIEVPAEEYLCTRIRRTEQALMAHHEAVLRGYGLTMTQYTVLLTLSREDGMSGAQLARSCGVTQQTMASVLTGLQNKELIVREASPVHAKVLIASLTEQGRRVLDGAYREVIVLERALADAFTPVERDSLCELLERATAVLVRQTPSAESRAATGSAGTGAADVRHSSSA
ncbi:MarR family winged helix-turn-helix transcriptional regulator [Streptosporangium sp. CA-135522]|uniref:MarR family winged helix-turn-helix transcriptional regulator n=1 Tax=Streptosporangium sp. CA-135522 TaxID=3240072 RepID=UPI003D9450DD